MRSSFNPDNAPAWTIEAAVPACLVNGSVPAADRDGLVRLRLSIEHGVIAAIEAAGEEADFRVGMILPAFVDMHTHLDKGHIWPRRPNPDGTFFGAVNATALDREANWSAADLAARMDFALRCAYAHGTCAIRTHLDSVGRQTAISWPVFSQMREKWAGRIELQAAALFTIEHVSDRAHVSAVTAAVREHGGVMGGLTYMVPELDQNLDTLFQLAEGNGLDLDFHVDETLDPSANSLDNIAEASLRHRFAGQITVGHCCSLSRRDEDDAKATIDKVARAGIAVVSLPMCNLYLQDRVPSRTPRFRGATLLHELKAAGVPVSVASDNTRDPFYAYGDLDMLEVFREATRIVHLDHPVSDWPRATAATPASVMGIDAGMLRIGGAADLVLFKARNWTELLSRPQADRIVLRAGSPIDTTLPDYAELDEILAATAP